MFTSFLDGTKSAIEMAAVANATGLVRPRTAFRSRRRGGGRALRPCVAGGGRAVVEVSSWSLRHLRWGVFVVFTRGRR